MPRLNDTKNSFAIHQATVANIHDINRGEGINKQWRNDYTIGYGLIVHLVIVHLLLKLLDEYKGMTDTYPICYNMPERLRGYLNHYCRLTTCLY